MTENPYSFLDKYSDLDKDLNSRYEQKFGSSLIISRSHKVSSVFLGTLRWILVSLWKSAIFLTFLVLFGMMYTHEEFSLEEGLWVIIGFGVCSIFIKSFDDFNWKEFAFGIIVILSILILLMILYP
jgi:hypothetical protein